MQMAVRFNAPVDLARLIANRKTAGAGSLRDMEQRAAEHDTPISRQTLSDYANGKVRAYPSESTRRALAHALGVGYEEVTAAALESAAPEMKESGGAQLQHAQAFLRLTDGRTDDEIEQLLGVVVAAMRAMDAHRRADGAT
jgi:transcriptional regulator with XRE-family HTH domain